MKVLGSSLAIAALIGFATPVEVIHTRCLEQTGSEALPSGEVPVLGYVDRDDLSPEEAKALGCQRHRFRIQWGMREILDVPADADAPADSDP